MHGLVKMLVSDLRRAACVWRKKIENWSLIRSGIGGPFAYAALSCLSPPGLRRLSPQRGGSDVGFAQWLTKDTGLGRTGMYRLYRLRRLPSAIPRYSVGSVHTHHSMHRIRCCKHIQWEGQYRDMYTTI
jgi:hypothetical protein